MIYLEPSSLGWQPVLQSWVNTLPDTLKSEHEKLIPALFQWALPVSISFVRKHCKVLTIKQGKRVVVILSCCS